MMIASVIIQPWKESIFVQELEADGYEFEVMPPAQIGEQPVVEIQVKHEDERRLEQLVKRAQDLAGRKRN